VIAGGARTIEVVDPDGARPSHVVACLGRTSYVGTATTVGDRLVVVGGYDEQIRASRDVWVLDRAAVTKPAS
jgi:hypothetical protein